MSHAIKRKVVSRSQTKRGEVWLVTERLECGHEHAYLKQVGGRPFPEERKCVRCANTGRPVGRPRLEVADLSGVSVEEGNEGKVYKILGHPIAVGELAKLFRVSVPTLKNRLRERE